MYFYLHGMITMHTADSIVVDCSGVGYSCFVSHPSEYPIGEVMYVFVYFYTHEEERYFVGFKTIEEKELFESLITVKDIGPKTALAALSESSVRQLKDAIDQSNVLYLKKLPGIGAKKASQIILDLRGKLTKPVNDTKTGEPNLDLAVEALRGLGFKEVEIKRAIENITERGKTVEEYTTIALRNIRG